MKSQLSTLFYPKPYFTLLRRYGGLVMVPLFMLLFFYVLLLISTLVVWSPLNLNPVQLQRAILLNFIIITALFAGLFVYMKKLLDKLHSANGTIKEADSHLVVLHDLTVALQSATDIEDVQEQVLEAVTSNLNFKRAVIGLVDSEKQVITGWLGRVREGEMLSTKGLPHPAQLPLAPTGGLVAHALLEQRICRATNGPCTSDGWINQHFGMQGCLILPMLWGIQPVGVLLVDVSENEEIEAVTFPSSSQTNFKINNQNLGVTLSHESSSCATEEPPLQAKKEVSTSQAIAKSNALRTLQAITQQTAIIVGMMSTRLRRAKERAVQEERARIALDMHDTVVQSLFGIVYTLNGCLKLLPNNPSVIQPELEWALQVAEEVRQDIRHSIHDMWPEPINTERFEANLRSYTADTLQATNLPLVFDVRGDFSTLSALAKRSIYRICQEALTNIVHHAAASEARICLDIVNGRAKLIVRDNGRGFEPTIVLAQQQNREHFGLRGIQERTQSLKGTCDIFSEPGAGTSIVIDIPVKI